MTLPLPCSCKKKRTSVTTMSKQNDGAKASSRSSSLNNKPRLVAQLGVVNQSAASKQRAHPQVDAPPQQQVRLVEVLRPHLQHAAVGLLVRNRLDLWCRLSSAHKGSPGPPTPRATMRHLRTRTPLAIGLTIHLRGTQAIQNRALALLHYQRRDFPLHGRQVSLESRLLRDSRAECRGGGEVV